MGERQDHLLMELFEFTFHCFVLALISNKIQFEVYLHNITMAINPESGFDFCMYLTYIV